MIVCVISTDCIGFGEVLRDVESDVTDSVVGGGTPRVGDSVCEISILGGVSIPGSKPAFLISILRSGFGAGEAVLDDVTEAELGLNFLDCNVGVL